MEQSTPMKKKASATRYVLLAVILINIVCGIQTTVITELYSSGTAMAIITLLMYLADILTMAASAIAFAFAYVTAQERGAGRGALCLLIPLVGAVAQSLTATVVALFDLTADAIPELIISNAFSLVFNLISLAVVYYAIYLASYFVALRRYKKYETCVPLFSMQSKFTLSSLITVGVSLVYNLVTVTRDTVEFITLYSPLYDSEIISIVVDYVFAVVSAVLFYFILWLCERKMIKSK